MDAVAFYQGFVDAVSKAMPAEHRDVLVMPQRTFRVFKAHRAAEQAASSWERSGANWRRVKREREKAYRREMRASRTAVDYGELEHT